jgi:atypical dual specificity phosphatase
VLENLVFHLPRRSALTRRMQIDAVGPLVEECGLQWVLDQQYAQVVELPLARQRMIAVLREAVAAPELLLVDEPTAGLAREDADAVAQVIATLARTRALLVVLHNLREARQLAARVALIAGGRLQEAGAPEAFFESPASESGRLFLATGSCPEPTRIVPPPMKSPLSVPSAACGPRGFAWLLPGRLAGTPWPGLIHGIDYDLQLLASVGVTHLVSLTEELFDPTWAAPYSMDCRAHPMPDMHAPSLPQAVAICREIDAMLGAGHVVAVHCRAGMGRTGTVLAAYWLWRGEGRLDALGALEDVRRMEPGWVQSPAQVAFLEAFAQGLAAGEIKSLEAAT